LANNEDHPLGPTQCGYWRIGLN